MSLREEKIARTKKTIFRAAMDLYREKGFDVTSVDEIVARAGYSRATFFNHFGSKQGVFRYFGEKLQESMTRLMTGAETNTDPLESVRQALLYMAKEVEKNREDLKVIYMYSMRDPEYLAGPTPARRRVVELISLIVKKGQDQNVIRRDIPLNELTSHIMFMYQYTVLSIISGKANAVASIDSIWRFMRGGILASN